MEVSLLDLLVQKQTDWIRMTKSFGSTNSPVPSFLINDIIHDMYIKLFDRYGSTPERIMYSEDKVNTMLVYVTLRNLYFDYTRKQKHRNYLPQEIIEGFELEVGDLNVEELHEIDRVELLIQKEIETWHHYDSRVFKLIYYEGMSMRKLSRETNISLSSIFNTVKMCRAKIENKIIEDNYNDILD